jgi:hypothetical protein
VAAISRTRYHLLVNNAGVIVYGPFTEVDLPDISRLLRLNCEALVTLAHTYVVRARPGDGLINVSSTLAHLPMPRLGVYSASKAFVTSLSETLSHENRDRGVFVMGLHPA